MLRSTGRRLLRRVTPADTPPPDPSDLCMFDLDAISREAATPSCPVTNLLRERLALPNAEELTSRLEPELREVWEDAPPAARGYLELSLSLHVGVSGAAERTGLSPEMPPPGVHLMGGGPVATGGSYYHADLVVEALERAGAGAPAQGTYLDFGCSSGRVVRVLQAAYADAIWFGCDPIDEAIRWARANIPGVTFHRSRQEPPLPYAQHQFDAAYAISIWSHFGPTAGPRWLAEMRRVIRPGGHLVLTTQGWKTIEHLARSDLWDTPPLCRAMRDLVSYGFHYWDVFGPAGDFGVKAPGEWGMAFLTLEWLLERIDTDWSVVSYQQGRNEGNQDVLVLQRR